MNAFTIPDKWQETREKVKRKQFISQNIAWYCLKVYSLVFAACDYNQKQLQSHRICQTSLIQIIFLPIKLYNHTESLRHTFENSKNSLSVHSAKLPLTLNQIIAQEEVKEIFKEISQEKETSPFIRNQSLTYDQYNDITKIKGIPVVTQYKYLGMMLDGQLNPKIHLSFINKKISFITYKLYPIRSLNNIKLNLNLFKTFIPLYRLCAIQYLYSRGQVKKQILVHIRVRLKIFCNLPINTPNEVLYLLFGNIKINLQKSINKIRNKYRRHMGEQQVANSESESSQQQIVTETPKIKFIPNKLRELLNILYKSTCRTHNNTVTSTSHLRQDHWEQLRGKLKHITNSVWTLNLNKLLIDFQNQKSKPTIRSRIKIVIEFVSQIRNVTGGKRGRRWKRYPSPSHSLSLNSNPNPIPAPNNNPNLIRIINK